MEWNNNMPLKLLEDMPTSFADANLMNIQAIIDKDKFASSKMLGRDLCGQYASFCNLCNKFLPNPCAVAFVRMKQAESAGAEVALTANEVKQPKSTDATEQQSESPATPPKKRIRIAIAKRKE